MCGEQQQERLRGLHAARRQIPHDTGDGNDDVVDRDRDAPRRIDDAARQCIDSLHGEYDEHHGPDPIDVENRAAGDDRGRRQRDDERGEDEQPGEPGE